MFQAFEPGFAKNSGTNQRKASHNAPAWRAPSVPKNVITPKNESVPSKMQKMTVGNTAPTLIATPQPAKPRRNAKRKIKMPITTPTHPKKPALSRIVPRLATSRKGDMWCTPNRCTRPARSPPSAGGKITATKPTVIHIQTPSGRTRCGAVRQNGQPAL
jgi:hypothetical protein